MTQVLQSGQHPDADELNAFVEHVLPAHEQQQMLAHLAVCPECRAIAYLAQPALVEEAAQPRPSAARRPWFSGWNLALPAGLAVALLVILSVHLRNVNISKHDAEVDKTARIEQPPSAPQIASPSPGVVVPKAMPAPIQKQQSSPAAPVGVFAAGSASNRVSRGDAHESSFGGFLAARNTNGLPASNSPGISDAALGGQAISGAGLKPISPAPAGAAGAASASASQAPQMAAISNLDTAHRDLRSSASQYNSAAVTAQSTVNQAFNAPPAPAPPPPASTPVPGAVSETVTVSSAPALLDTESNASAQVIEGRTLGALATPSLKMRKQPSLPSHLPVVSTVSNTHQELAVDSAGSLFRSNDAGVSWQPVPVQWTGRAVKLQLSPAPNPRDLAKSADAAAATGSEKRAPTAALQITFELTNQASDTWISADGKTWKRK